MQSGRVCCASHARFASSKPGWMYGSPTSPESIRAELAAVSAVHGDLTEENLAAGRVDGVIVGQNTARDDNKFILLVRDFDDDRTRVNENALGQGVQVLFSPDDSVVLVDDRGVASSGTVGLGAFPRQV